MKEQRQNLDKSNTSIIQELNELLDSKSPNESEAVTDKSESETRAPSSYVPNVRVDVKEYRPVDQRDMETLQGGMDTDIEDIEKSVEALFNKIAELELPLSEKKDMLYAFSRSARNHAQTLVPPIPKEIPPNMQFKNERGACAYSWLKKHYKPWLKHFNPSLDRDYLYQDQLRQLDSALMKKLRGQSKKILQERGCSIQDIVSPQKERTMANLEMFTLEEKKHFLHLLVQYNNMQR